MQIQSIFAFHARSGDYWHICFEDGSGRTYEKRSLRIEVSCLGEKKAWSRLDYLRQLAAINELKSDDGAVLLEKQYEKLIFVGQDTAMAVYLDPTGHGYLPKPIKKIADEIVDQMERLPVVSDCYDRWLELKGQVDSYSGGDKRKHLPLSQQKEFRAIKNAVIQEAERIRLGEITFEDAGMEQRNEPDGNLRADRSLWQNMDDVYDDTLPLAERDKAAEDLREWAEDGDACAQYFLGKLYRDGGLLIPNTELARDWLYKAARQDVVVAQYALGKLFLSDDA